MPKEKAKRGERKEGVYQKGKFSEYGSNESHKTDLVFYDREIMKQLEASHGIIHGIYENGTFRPFGYNPHEARAKKDYAGKIEINGKKYNINFEGEVFTEDGQIAGLLDDKRRVIPLEKYREIVKNNLDAIAKGWMDQETPKSMDTKELSQREKFLRATVTSKAQLVGLDSRGYELAFNRYSEDKETEGERERKGGLEKAALAAAIIGIFGGSFLLSPNFTGNAIINLPSLQINIIGTLLFLIGVGCVTLYVLYRKGV